MRVYCAVVSALAWLLVACTGPQPGQTGQAAADSTALAALLPADGQVDSCSRTGSTGYFTTQTLCEKINGGDQFYLDRGFIACVYQTYTYPQPALTKGRDFTVMLSAMSGPDSARSIFNVSLAWSDPAEVLPGLNGRAIITRGSWSYSCCIHQDRYFIQFQGVAYDTTSGARGSIRAKFGEFCGFFKEKIHR